MASVEHRAQMHPAGTARAGPKNDGPTDKRTADQPTAAPGAGRPRRPLQLGLFDETPPPRPPAPRPPPRDAARALAARLGPLLPDGLSSLVLTDNRSRIVSARPAAGGEGLEVRIHRSFADASDAVLRSVAGFLQSRRGSAARRRALRAIREHFVRHGPRPEAAPRRPASLRPVGRFFDLRELRDGLDQRYFGGGLEVAITWGRARRGTAARRRRRRRRGRCGFSIRLGSYDERRNLVRIHHCLDRAEVPRFVVESVVYHEMLHAALPPVVVNGRRRIHTPEFRRRERLFHRYDEAERWIDENLERLAGWR